MSLADIVAVMPPATWYELPGTSLSSNYAITDTGDPRYGVKGPQSVPEDWCGGAFDTDNHIFLLHGGGHRSYGGNEVYEFSLDTLAWTHNTPSTYIEDGTSSGGQNWKTTDGSPTSVHSYGGLQYIPGANKLFKFGGARWESGDPGDSYAYLYDTLTHIWTRGALAPVNVLEPATAYDASRHCIWVLGRNELLRYNITADTWDTAQGGIASQTGRVAAYDPVNDRLVFVSGMVSPNVCYYDCAAGGGLQAVTVTGDSFGKYEVGLVYDPTRNTFVVWGGYGSVYSIDPTTWVATQIDAGTGATPAPPSTDYHGVYSKWQYLPTYDAFIGYNGATQNAWIYKAGTAGSGPAPGWGDPQRSCPLTVAAGKVTGTHTGFRVVITRANLPDEMCDPSGSNAAQINGGDIRVTADAAGTIRLPLHALKFAHDSATGAKDAGVELWAKVPSMDASTKIYVWYHSETTQAQPAAGEAYGRDEVYSGLIAGYHCDSTGTVVDVTGGGGDISVSGSPGTVAGPYSDNGLAVNFNTTATSTSLSLDQDYTVSALIQRPGNFSTGTALVLRGSGEWATIIRGDASTTVQMQVSNGPGTAQDMATLVSVATDAWTLLSVATTNGSGTQTAYKDGSQIGSITAPRKTGDGVVELGGASTSVYWGKLFVAKGLLSEDWLATQANNLSDPDTFFVAGTPQNPAVPAEVDISAGSLALAGQSLAAAAGQAISLQPGALTLSGQAFAVQVGADVPVSVAIGAGSLTFAGLAMQARAGVSAALSPATLSIDGKPMSVSVGMVEAIGPASITLAGQTLSFAAGASVAVDIGAGVLTISGATIEQVAGMQAAIAAGALTLTGQKLEFDTGGPMQILSARLVVIHGADRIARVH